MNRRALLSGLLGATGGLVLPWEPRRVYSFGERVGVSDSDYLQALLDRGGHFRPPPGNYVLTRPLYLRGVGRRFDFSGSTLTRASGAHPAIVVECRHSLIESCQYAPNLIANA